MSSLTKNTPRGFWFGEMSVSRICYDEAHGALLQVASKKHFVEIRVSAKGDLLKVSKKFKRVIQGSGER